MRLKNSEHYLNKALEVIPEGSQTKSKMACRFPENFPKFISRGKGSHVWDVDGNEYIDWVMGLGPIILGHAFPEVIEAVHLQSQRGNVFALPAVEEQWLAELLRLHIPCAEMSRFARNGGDATMGAVRLARAITGKERILYSGYHGGMDWYANEIKPNCGTIEQPINKFDYNDMGSIRDWILNIYNDEVACVIMEVPPEEPKEGYIQSVIDLCHERGALFILDEIVTGLRYSMGGAQEKYGIVPDLACFSKALGNGFPISAICGKKEYMEHFNDIFFSTTFGGELTGIVAAKTTVELCYELEVANHIDEIGSALRDGIKDMCYYGYLYNEGELELKGNPARSILDFKNITLKTVFLQEVIKHGVLMGVPIFPCYSHTMDDVNQTLYAINQALKYVWRHRTDSDKGLIGQPISMIGSPRR